MKNIEAIIFDKDGTLMNFDAFWVAVSIKAIQDILKQTDKADIPVDEILESFGVHDSITDIDSVLCKGTYEQMGQIVHRILSQHGRALPCDTVVSMVIDAYNRHADAGDIAPTCPDLAKVLTELQNRGIKLAVVTTDNPPITRKCLQKLGIEALFDKIYTDDGVTPTKPDPFCVYDFCQLTGVKKENVLMVGDTMTDVLFAQNAGIAVVGLAKNDNSKKVLAPHADMVLSALSQLLDILE